MSEVEASVEHELPNQREWSATTHGTRTMYFQRDCCAPMSGTRNYACKEVEANVEHELPNQTEWSATTHATRTCIFRGIVVPP